MSQRKQQAAATATFGYAGVAGGALLRNDAIADAHGERPGSVRPRVPRAAIGAERRILRAGVGRKRYLAGATLATLAAPAAAKGTHDLLAKRRTFVEDGVSGVTESLQEKNRNTRRAPTKLVAGNYLAGTAVAAGAGAGAGHLLRSHPSGRRSVIASTGAVLAGTASLPIQRRIIEHKTKGAYTATPTGLKRVVKPVNHGARHGTRVAKTNDASTGMSRAEELRNLKRKQRTAAVNATTSVAGIGSLGLLGAAALPHVKNRAALVRTATTIGTASAGAGSLNGLEGARLQRRDLKARERVLASKALPPRKHHLIYWQGNGYRRLNNAARQHPRRRAAFADAEYARQGHKATGGHVRQFEMTPYSAYERQTGKVVKAYGLPRVPRVRRGFLRQTRTATGVTTSAVRGGLIR